MKKAFDQTFRDIKRGVNKKVLKVPGVEQKVLDATSNEPWGPHGSLLADIANASKNFNDYQLIMTIIWKRVNDTGKNWRHVYKGLTVLEYLVAHGSERVIEEIKEHAYQISTLSDFQYIDSSGRDQGSNVRKKSQGLVILVNDKERILEVRQKAASNRDKFNNTSSTGGMYKPSSGGYGDRYDDEGRYGSREDDRNSNGREDDRYGKLGDNSSRDGDRYGRDYEERYGRDGYRDDHYQGRSRSVDDYNYGTRSRSSDRDREHANEDEGNSSARGSGARADEHSQDGRRHDRKFSEQNLSAPPSYEEAVNDARSPVHSEGGGETTAASAPKAASPPASTSPTQATTDHAAVDSPPNQGFDTFDEFDPRGSFSAAPSTSIGAEMDLLGSLLDPSPSNALAIVSSAPATSSSEADAFAYAGSGPVFSATSPVVSQPFEDPFGDTPFKATPSWESSVPAQTSEQPQTHPFASEAGGVSNFNFADTFPGISYTSNSPFMSQEMSAPNQDIDILADILPPSGPSATLPTSQSNFTPQPPNPSVNESFYPESGSIVPVSYFAPQVPSGPSAPQNNGFLPQSEFTGPVASQMAPQAPTGTPAQYNGAGFFQQPGSNGPPVASQMAPQAPTGPAAQYNGASFFQQPGSNGPPVASQMAPQAPTGTAAQYNGASFFQQPESNGPPVASYTAPQVASTTAPNNTGNFLSQSGFSTPAASQTALHTPMGPTPTNYMNSQPNHHASAGQLAIVPQPSKEKFETKSTVWADTLNRGLVNLNISGAKINPLSDIGIDFDAINRKEKRMEKHVVAAPVASTITMGKAMGSGSGIGRAGAGAIRPSSNPMMGMGMGGAPNAGMGMGMAPNAGMGMGMAPNAAMGMGMAPNAAMAMGGYGGMNQQMAMGMGGYGGMNQQMGMGMGMNQQMGMGMGMNQQMGMGMGMGQGGPMQPQTGMPPGAAMQGGYNPMMGGAYPPQQPYGGGHR